MSAIGDLAVQEYAQCPHCRWTRPVTAAGRMAPHAYVDVNGHVHKETCRGTHRPTERRFDR